MKRGSPAASRRIEKRYPHDHFKRVLSKIVARLNEADTFDVEWHDTLLNRRERSRFRIAALYTFGSWAKGTATCGDLDLSVDVDVLEGHEPPERVISGRLIRGFADVRLHIRKRLPDEFEQVPIWSREKPDATQCIASVVRRRGASRFRRKTDLLPLRLEQTAGTSSPGEFDGLVDLIESDVVRSEWIDVTTRTLKLTDWRSEDFSFLAEAKGKARCGRKTFDVLLDVVEHLRGQSGGSWRVDWDEKATFRRGGTRIILGRPFVSIDELSNLSCSKLVIAPHRSRRGPNGLWILTRGSKHELLQSFGEVQAFILVSEGLPLMDRVWSGWRDHAEILSIFGSRTAAQEAARTKGWSDLKVTHLRGERFLSVISDCDVVQVGRRRIALTIEGSDLDRSKKKAPEQVQRRLKDALKGV